MRQWGETYKSIRFPSPVNTPSAIDVIWFRNGYLHKQYVKNQAVMWQFSVTYNLVSLPSPVKAPLAIDVIWLLYKSLQEQYVRTHIVT